MLTISDANRRYCFDKQQDDQLVSEKKIDDIYLYQLKSN